MLSRTPRLPGRRGPESRSPPAARSWSRRGTPHSFWNAVRGADALPAGDDAADPRADRGAALGRAHRLRADLRGARLRAVWRERTSSRRTPMRGAPLHRRAHVRPAAARRAAARRRRRRGDRRAVRHRDELPERRALRARGDPRGVDAAAPVPPGARRRRVRHAVAGRRRRPEGHPRQRAAHDRADRRSSCGRCSRPGSCRSSSAAITRSCSASCAPSTPSHGPVALVLLDAHADTWDQYYGERYFHGTPFRRAVEEGLVDPSRSLLAGMRGPLYGPEDVEVPRELGFEVIPGPDLVAMTPGRVRRPGPVARRRSGRCTCRSTSTCSTRRRRRAPARPRWPGSSRARRSAFLRALAGIVVHRVRRGRGRAGVRLARPDHGAQRRRGRLRPAGAAGGGATVSELYG